MLPRHGKIDCRECFTDHEEVMHPHDAWRMVNNPGAWGSAEPEVLVLGFSKGATQVDLYEKSLFEDVAFGGPARKRLTKILQDCGVIKPEITATSLISNPNSSIAFGSLVRCSLSRLSTSEESPNNSKYISSGNLILKSFKEIPDILSTCSKKFLTQLPPSLNIIVLLGINKSYIKKCRDLVDTITVDSVEEYDWNAYTVDNRLWIHLPHPSPANGSLFKWLAHNSNTVKKTISQYRGES